MTDNDLKEKKIHSYVWVTLNDYSESMELATTVSVLLKPKYRDKMIKDFLNRKYGKNGWLSYSVD